MPKKAIGLPDPESYGDTGSLRRGSIVPLFTQEHDAERAGKHTDLRIGGPKGKLLSWAVPKGVPEPGQKRLAIRQSLHEESYGPWEGRIEEGYGKGIVESGIRGKALITNVGKDFVTFSTAHERYPQRFRLQQTKDGNWLLINVTPKDAREYGKIRYSRVDPDKVEQVLTPENLVQAKIDGSAEWLEILGDKIESLSYRTSKKTGRPIVHTERVGSPRMIGEVPPKEEVLKEARGPETVLRGELYGARDGRPVSPAETGGLLNASIQRSLEKQKEQGITPQHAVFDILKYRGEDVRELPYEQRLKLVRAVLKQMPKEFQEPPTAETPEEARELVQAIMSKKHPLTSEGIVAHPRAGGRPTKVKRFEDADVYIREIFPGKGKYEGTGAGGFAYSLTPEGPVVGRVGGGLSDEDRRDMSENPEAWLGRTARIKADEQFESGAYRAPRFIARHEDYPMNKQAYIDGYLQKQAIDSFLDKAKSWTTRNLLTPRMADLKMKPAPGASYLHRRAQGREDRRRTADLVRKKQRLQQEEKRLSGKKRSSADIYDQVLALQRKNMQMKQELKQSPKISETASGPQRPTHLRDVAHLPVRKQIELLKQIGNPEDVVDKWFSQQDQIAEAPTTVVPNR